MGQKLVIGTRKQAEQMCKPRELLVPAQLGGEFKLLNLTELKELYNNCLEKSREC